MTNPAQQTVIYTTQPAADGSQSLVIGSGGSLFLGTLILPPVPSAISTTATYKLSVNSSGVTSWVAG